MMMQVETESANDRPRRWLRPRDCQERIGIRASKFWNLVRDGALPTRKLGRVTLIAEEDVEKLIASLPFRKPVDRRAA